MERRTIVAALMLLLGSAAAAGEFASPTYGQAADLAAGRTAADTGYDGSPARLAVKGQVSGALATGGLTVPPVTPTSSRTLLAPRPVPAPGADAEAHSKSFFSKRGLMLGAGGAAAGALAGWFLGGPLGALIGAGAGFAIGFLLSKFLHR